MTTDTTSPIAAQDCLTILYRGPLSSCNYDCYYCPFAKHHETAAELRVDREALERFIDWIEFADRQFSILFTPWGEGMTRRWYRDGLQRLTSMPHVRKAAIQTNLSWDPEWVGECDLSRLGLWCTWHPEQVDYSTFLQKCHRLSALGASYSVGIVGLRDYYDHAVRLRGEMPKQVYLWVNAYKDSQDYYTEEEIAAWKRIDPLFETNNTRHPSLGKECRAGESVISVDGDGNVRRCHFIKEPIGNIYDAQFGDELRSRNCTNQTCGCHIGYVHLHELKLYDVFGDGVLERVPTQKIW